MLLEIVFIVAITTAQCQLLTIPPLPIPPPAISVSSVASASIVEEFTPPVYPPFNHPIPDYLKSTPIISQPPKPSPRLQYLQPPPQPSFVDQPSEIVVSSTATASIVEEISPPVYPFNYPNYPPLTSVTQPTKPSPRLPFFQPSSPVFGDQPSEITVSSVATASIVEEIAPPVYPPFNYPMPNYPRPTPPIVAQPPKPLPHLPLPHPTPPKTVQPPQEIFLSSVATSTIVEEIAPPPFNYPTPNYPLPSQPIVVQPGKSFPYLPTPKPLHHPPPVVVQPPPIAPIPAPFPLPHFPPPVVVTPPAIEILPPVPQIIPPVVVPEIPLPVTCPFLSGLASPFLPILPPACTGCCRCQHLRKIPIAPPMI